MHEKTYEVTLKVDDTIMIGDNIKLVIVNAQDKVAKIGVQAPREMLVIRGELQK